MDPLSSWYRSITRSGLSNMRSEDFVRMLNSVPSSSTSSIAKASLMGLALDLLPWLFVARLKFSQAPNLRSVLDELRKDLVGGGMFRRIRHHYPTLNSWLSSLFFTALFYQLLQPRKRKNLKDVKVSEKDEEGVKKDEEDVTDKSSKGRGKVLFIYKNGLDETMKHFLASLTSATVGLWLLRSRSPTSNEKSNNMSLALYTLMQAVHAIWVSQRLYTLSLNKKWELSTPWMKIDLKKLGDKAEIGFFTVSCYHIMKSWFYEPHNLPRSYANWITRFSNFNPHLMIYLRETWFGRVRIGKHSDVLDKYCQKKGIDPKLADPFNGIMPCHVLHPIDGSNCSRQTARRFLITFRQALLTTYLPLNVVTFIIKHKNLTTLHSTKEFFQRLASKVILPSMRSSAFLATFVDTIFLSICVTRHATGTDNYGPITGSALCGFFSILVESPSRRLNLTLYVLPRALDILYRKYLQSSLPSRYLEFPLFAVSSATLLTCFQLNFKSVQAPARAVLNWVCVPAPELPQV